MIIKIVVIVLLALFIISCSSNPYSPQTQPTPISQGCVVPTGNGLIASDLHEILGIEVSNVL